MITVFLILYCIKIVHIHAHVYTCTLLIHCMQCKYDDSHKFIHVVAVAILVRVEGVCGGDGGRTAQTRTASLINCPGHGLRRRPTHQTEILF